MSRLISDLPENLRKLAEERRKVYFFPPYGKDEDRLSFSFDWDATPEGDRFWRNIDNNKEMEENQDGIFK